MARAVTEKECQTFFDTIPEGRTVADCRASNQSMRNALGWSDERYERVRTFLLARGVIKKGLGRGGSIVRASRKLKLGALAA